jgi:hypothetical protein
MLGGRAIISQQDTRARPDYHSKAEGELYSVQVTGVQQVTNNLISIQRKQIPFATSRAVNACAYAVQRDTIEVLLPSKFTLRTDWWKPGRKTGVNYFPSNKRQTPIKAIVNTLAWFMEDQEIGGTRGPSPGQPYRAIPTYSAQPNKRERIRSNRTFRQLVTGKRAGRRTLAHRGDWWIKSLKNGIPSVAVRLLDKHRLPIAVMYIGKASVTIKPRFGFVANATKLVSEIYQPIFDRELKAAIQTAR